MKDIDVAELERRVLASAEGQNWTDKPIGEDEKEWTRCLVRVTVHFIKVMEAESDDRGSLQS